MKRSRVQERAGAYIQGLYLVRLNRKRSLFQSPLTGFTLIELILVLVIIGFLTSLVAPAITSTTGLRLKTTTKRVAAGLRFARSQAVISGSNYRAAFDLENGKVTIESLAEENSYRDQMSEESWLEEDVVPHRIGVGYSHCRNLAGSGAHERAGCPRPLALSYG